MIVGFVIKKADGGSVFGVFDDKGGNLDATKEIIAETTSLDAGDELQLISAEEALSQLDGVAFLSPAEL